MDQEVMLSNYLSKGGIWNVHLVRMGAPVAWESWADRLPSLVIAETHRWRWNDEVGVHHLVAAGPVQDVIEAQWLERAGDRTGRPERMAFWWCAHTSIREGIRDAAERLWIAEGREAGEALVQRMPRGAPGSVTVNCLGRTVEIPLREAHWVPRWYVVVRGEGG